MQGVPRQCLKYKQNDFIMTVKRGDIRNNLRKVPQAKTMHIVTVGLDDLGRILSRQFLSNVTLHLK